MRLAYFSHGVPPALCARFANKTCSAKHQFREIGTTARRTAVPDPIPRPLFRGRRVGRRRNRRLDIEVDMSGRAVERASCIDEEDRHNRDQERTEKKSEPRRSTALVAAVFFYNVGFLVFRHGYPPREFP